MLKVMLVDDEPLLRMGLKQAFDWDSVGCVVVAEAENGAEALEKYNDAKPDIIITDIRMSAKDGLQLIAALREGKSDAEIIVLSGYDDFSYAKQAMEAGVFSYLLKPVNLDELANTLKSLKEKIDQKRKTGTALSALRAEELIMKLANGSGGEEMLCANEDFFSKLPKNFITAVIAVDNKSALGDRLIKVSHILRGCTDDLLAESENFIVRCMLEQTKYMLTIFTQNVHSYDDAMHSLEKFLADFREKSGATATIGISGICRNLKMISKAYDQAEQALRHKAIAGNNRIIDFIRVHTGVPGEYDMTKEEMNAVCAAAKEKNCDAARAVVNKYFSRLHEFSNVSIGRVRARIAELGIMIVNATASGTDTMNMIYGRAVNPVEELQNMELISDIKEWILSLIACLESVNLPIADNIKNETVRQAVGYIVAHYSKPITIEWVAGKMFVSPRHISRCFRSELGMTFNDCLTKYRISKAESLLADGGHKIYEIARLVGYNDSKYFCKLFKKITGKTPQEYKK